MTSPNRTGVFVNRGVFAALTGGSGLSYDRPRLVLFRQAPEGWQAAARKKRHEETGLSV